MQVAIGLGNGHDRAVAVDGVAGGGEVPASTFGGLRHVAGGTADGGAGFASVMLNVVDVAVSDMMNNKARVRAFIA